MITESNEIFPVSGLLNHEPSRWLMVSGMVLLKLIAVVEYLPAQEAFFDSCVAYVTLVEMLPEIVFSLKSTATTLNLANENHFWLCEQC